MDADLAEACLYIANVYIEQKAFGKAGNYLTRAQQAVGTKVRSLPPCPTFCPLLSDDLFAHCPPTPTFLSSPRPTFCVPPLDLTFLCPSKRRRPGICSKSSDRISGRWQVPLAATTKGAPPPHVNWTGCWIYMCEYAAGLTGGMQRAKAQKKNEKEKSRQLNAALQRVSLCDGVRGPSGEKVM